MSGQQNNSPIRLNGSVASRISTVNAERQLLHALLSSRLTLQRLIGKHRSEFFTNRSRLFIYERMSESFNDRRSVLTKENLEFEIQKRYDSAKDKAVIDDIMAEYAVIMKTDVTGEPEGIIQTLEQVQLANNVENLIRQSYALLEDGKYEEAAAELRQKSIDLRSAHSENRIINLHEDSDDWFEEVRNRKDHPEQYAGIPTGFKKFDDLTGGLFPAELTVVFGLSGKGKSTFMKALSCNIRKEGRVILHCGNEENEFQMRSKYMSADSGEKYKPFKNGKYTEEEYLRLKKFSDGARGHGAIYVYEFPQQTDATWIERAYNCLEMRGVHVDVIVVDYLDLMKPIAKAYSENDEGGKITSDLKQLAINCNCPVITATQAGIQSEKQEKKARPFLSASDVFGTKRKVHSANVLIGIVNQTVTAMAQELTPEQRNRHKMVLCVPKNRDGATFTFRQIMDVECGKFYEDDDPDDPVMNNLEKQSQEMIDETIPPEMMRSEVSEEELQKAKSEHISRGLAKLKENLDKSDSEPMKSEVARKMAEEDAAFGKTAESDGFSDDSFEDDSLDGPEESGNATCQVIGEHGNVSEKSVPSDSRYVKFWKGRVEKDSESHMDDDEDFYDKDESAAVQAKIDAVQKETPAESSDATAESTPLMEDQPFLENGTEKNPPSQAIENPSPNGVSENGGTTEAKPSKPSFLSMLAKRKA